MTKRLTIAVLWFVAVWSVGGVAHLAFDVPRALVLVPAAGAAIAWYVGLARYEARAAERRLRAHDRIRALAASTVAPAAVDA
jgi:hypothetical protein